VSVGRRARRVAHVARNYRRGTKPGWKKAIVQLRQGESIEIFEGAQA